MLHSNEQLDRPIITHSFEATDTSSEKIDNIKAWIIGLSGFKLPLNMEKSFYYISEQQ